MLGAPEDRRSMPCSRNSAPRAADVKAASILLTSALMANASRIFLDARLSTWVSHGTKLSPASLMAAGMTAVLSAVALVTTTLHSVMTRLMSAAYFSALRLAGDSSNAARTPRRRRGK